MFPHPTYMFPYFPWCCTWKSEKLIFYHFTSRPWPWLDPKAFAHICQGNSPGVAPRTKRLGPSNRYVTNLNRGVGIISLNLICSIPKITHLPGSTQVAVATRVCMRKWEGFSNNWKLNQQTWEVFVFFSMYYHHLLLHPMFVYGKFPWFSRVRMVSSLGSFWSKNNHGMAGMSYEEPKEWPMNLWGDSHCSTKKEIGPRLQNTDCNFSWKYSIV